MMKSLLNKRHNFIAGVSAGSERRRFGHISRNICIPMMLVAAVLLSVFSPVAMTAFAGGPVCGVAEHTHTAACYGNVLTCGLEGTPAHTHGDGCYSLSQRFACGLGGDHVHGGEECYITEKTLICDKKETAGHSHSGSCYTRTLVCGQREHTHTADCYPPPESAPETPATSNQPARGTTAAATTTPTTTLRPAAAATTVRPTAAPTKKPAATKPTTKPVGNYNTYVPTDNNYWYEEYDEFEIPVYPYFTGNLSVSTNTVIQGEAAPGDTLVVTDTWSIADFQPGEIIDLEGSAVIAFLPQGLGYEEDTASVSERSIFVSTEPDIAYDYLGTGLNALIWDLTGTYTVGDGCDNLFNLAYNVKVYESALINSYDELTGGFTTPVNIASWHIWPAAGGIGAEADALASNPHIPSTDVFDLNGNEDFYEIFLCGTASFNCVPMTAGLIALKGAAGPEGNYVYYPATALVEPEDTASYRIDVINYTGGPLDSDSFRLFDALPYENDKFAGPLTPSGGSFFENRESDFPVRLTGPVGILSPNMAQFVPDMYQFAPEPDAVTTKFVISYATEKASSYFKGRAGYDGVNQYDEGVGEGWISEADWAAAEWAGWANPDAEAEYDWADVRAFKVNLNAGEVLGAGERLVMTMPVSLPDSVTEGVAWGSCAVSSETGAAALNETYFNSPKAGIELPAEEEPEVSSADAAVSPGEVSASQDDTYTNSDVTGTNSDVTNTNTVGPHINSEEIRVNSPKTETAPENIGPVKSLLSGFVGFDSMIPTFGGADEIVSPLGEGEIGFFAEAAMGLLAVTNPRADLSNFVTGVVVKDNLGNVVNDGEDVTAGQSYTFSISFKEKTNLQFEYEGGVLTYNMPEGITPLIPINNAPIIGTGPSKPVIGEYSVTTGGEITVVFKNVYVDGKPAPGNFIDMYANAGFTLDILSPFDDWDGFRDFDFGNNISLGFNFIEPEGVPKAVKKASAFNFATRTANYTVDVTADGGDLFIDRFSDILRVGETELNNTQISISNIVVDGVSYGTPTGWNGSTWYVGLSPEITLAKNQSIQVTYTVDYTNYISDAYGSNHAYRNYSFTARNTAAVSCTSANGNKKDASATANVTANHTFLAKSGVYSEGPPAKISWTLSAGDGVTKLNGQIITDTLSNDATMGAVTLTLYGQNGTTVLGTGTPVITGNTFTYTVPPTPSDVYYVKATYDTDVKSGVPEGTDVTNTIDAGGDGYTARVKAGESPSVTIVDKYGEWLDEDNIKWTVVLDVPAGLQGKYFQYTDVLVPYPWATSVATNIPQNLTVTLDGVPVAEMESPLGWDFIPHTSVNTRTWMLNFGASFKGQSFPLWPLNYAAQVVITYTTSLSCPTTNFGTLKGFLDASPANYLINQAGIAGNSITPSIFNSNKVKWPVYKKENISNRIVGTNDVTFDYEVILNSVAISSSPTWQMFNKLDPAIFFDEFDGLLQYVPGSFFAEVYRRTQEGIYGTLHSTYKFPGAGVTDATVVGSGIQVNLADLVFFSSSGPDGKDLGSNWYTADDYIIVVRYKLKLDNTDNILDQVVLKNTAGVMANGYKNKANVNGRFTSGVEIKFGDKAVQKAMNPDGNLAQFTITLNPAGLTMAEDGANLCVTDRMTDNMTFYLTSFKAYSDIDPNTGLHTGGGNIIYEHELTRTLTLEPETLWSWTLTDNNEFTVVIPDETPVMLNYDALVKGAIGINKIENYVEIAGKYFDLFAGNFYLDGGGGHSQSSLGEFLLFKNDETDPLKFLPGAEFELYVGWPDDLYPPPDWPGGSAPSPTFTLSEYDDYTFYYLDSDVTGPDGAILFAHKWLIPESVIDGAVFAVKEINPPLGYERPVNAVTIVDLYSGKGTDHVIISNTPVSAQVWIHGQKIVESKNSFVPLPDPCPTFTYHLMQFTDETCETLVYSPDEKKAYTIGSGMFSFDLGSVGFGDSYYLLTEESDLSHDPDWNYDSTSYVIWVNVDADSKVTILYKDFNDPNAVWDELDHTVASPPVKLDRSTYNANVDGAEYKMFRGNTLVMYKMPTGSGTTGWLNSGTPAVFAALPTDPSYPEDTLYYAYCADIFDATPANHAYIHAGSYNRNNAGSAVAYVLLHSSPLDYFDYDPNSFAYQLEGIAGKKLEAPDMGDPKFIDMFNAQFGTNRPGPSSPSDTSPYYKAMNIVRCVIWYFEGKIALGSPNYPDCDGVYSDGMAFLDAFDAVTDSGGVRMSDKLRSNLVANTGPNYTLDQQLADDFLAACRTITRMTEAVNAAPAGQPITELGMTFVPDTASSGTLSFSVGGVYKPDKVYATLGWSGSGVTVTKKGESTPIASGDPIVVSAEYTVTWSGTPEPVFTLTQPKTLLGQSVQGDIYEDLNPGQTASVYQRGLIATADFASRDYTLDLGGTLTLPPFVNTYGSPPEYAELQLKANKITIGNEMEAGNFNFELYEVDFDGDKYELADSSPLLTAQNSGGGFQSLITFGTITFEAEDDYYFYLKESAPNNSENWLTDDTGYLIRVVVERDNGNFKITAVNFITAQEDGGEVTPIGDLPLIWSDYDDEQDPAVLPEFTNLWAGEVLPHSGGPGAYDFIKYGMMLITVSLLFMLTASIYKSYRRRRCFYNMLE
ncbi:MAG: hypothetical protein FWE86_00290 [Oscillospiraceae bacterium]|nr:hypothetical protein [Oscillospiraceae bacterium]